MKPKHSPELPTRLFVVGLALFAASYALSYVGAPRFYVTALAIPGFALYAVSWAVSWYQARRGSGAPFDSADIDTLADRMKVTPFLRKDQHKRYFKTEAKIAAATSGGSVVFGERVYDNLTEGQRLALAAHEFAHIRQHDGDYKVSHLYLPSILIWGLFFLASIVVRGSAAPIGFLFWVGLPLALIFGSILFEVVYAEGFRERELRCDIVAASFVDGEDLISGLSVSDSLIDPKTKRSLLYRTLSRTYPTLEERAAAIRATAHQKMDSMPVGEKFDS